MVTIVVADLRVFHKLLYLLIFPCPTSDSIAQCDIRIFMTQLNLAVQALHHIKNILVLKFLTILMLNLPLGRGRPLSGIFHFVVAVSVADNDDADDDNDADDDDDDNLDDNDDNDELTVVGAPGGV